MKQPTKTLLGYLLTAAIIVAASLLWRWVVVDPRAGAEFSPQPDAIEYVAGAQSLAHEGRFHLRLGNEVYRPIYPIGMSALLALPLALGVAAEDLAFWNGIVASLHALLLAFAAAWLVRCWQQHAVRVSTRVETDNLDAAHGLDAPSSLPRARPVAGWIAAATTGLAWASAPSSVDYSRWILSDESAALASSLALLLTVIGFVTSKRAAAVAACFAGGLALGVACAVRPTQGPLALPVLLALGLMTWRERGFALAFRRTLLLVLGALLPILAAAAGIAHSGWDPLALVAYDQWTPGFEWSQRFALKYWTSGEPFGGFEFGLRQVLGAYDVTKTEDPGRSIGLGFAWPALTLLLASFLFSRRGPRRYLILALLWIAAHVVLYGFYSFRAQRFFLAPQATLCLALGLVVARLLAASTKARVAALCLLVFAALNLIYGSASLERASISSERNEETRRLFAEWIAKSDAERAALIAPFDSVRAQALGLYTPSVLKKVEDWGRPSNDSRGTILETTGRRPKPRSPIRPDWAPQPPAEAFWPGLVSHRAERLELLPLTGSATASYELRTLAQSIELVSAMGGVARLELEGSEPLELQLARSHSGRSLDASISGAMHGSLRFALRGAAVEVDGELAGHGRVTLRALGQAKIARAAAMPSRAGASDLNSGQSKTSTDHSLSAEPRVWQLRKGKTLRVRGYFVTRGLEPSEHSTFVPPEIGKSISKLRLLATNGSERLVEFSTATPAWPAGILQRRHDRPWHVLSWSLSRVVPCWTTPDGRTHRAWLTGIRSDNSYELVLSAVGVASTRVERLDG